MASSQSRRVLQEAILSIQSRLVNEEETRLSSLQRNGGQLATLAELRATQRHEAKLAILEELLGSSNHNDGARGGPSGLTGGSEYREFRSRVAPRIAVECIFGQGADEHGNGRRQSHQRFRPTAAGG